MSILGIAVAKYIPQTSPPYNSLDMYAVPSEEDLKPFKNLYFKLSAEQRRSQLLNNLTPMKLIPPKIEQAISIIKKK